MCNLLHPTVLHIQRAGSDTATSKANGTENRIGEVKVGYVDVGCQLTRTRDLTGVPVILPVVLRCKSTGVSTQTYAFLDNGSDAVFCTEKIKQLLNVGSQKTKLNLHTITETKLVDSYMLKGLEVTDLDGRNVIELPTIYTQEEIPVSKQDIVTQEDISRWSYLRDVRLPSINADIGLLIGNNVPKASEPWTVVNSQGDGPYAVRTLLGWSVNGPLKGAGTTAVRVSVNRIHINTQIDQQLANYFNQELSERTIDDEPERSAEDKRFMDMMATNAKYEDGHYQVPLPFRNPGVKMPDNRSVAEQRLTHLKRRFVKDQKYLEDYRAFMRRHRQRLRGKNTRPGTGLRRRSKVVYSAPWSVSSPEEEDTSGVRLSSRVSGDGVKQFASRSAYVVQTAACCTNGRHRSYVFPGESANGV